MNTTTQSPLSIGQVLDAGFKLYRQSFKAVVPLTLLAAVLGLIPTLIFGVQLTLTGLGAGYFILAFAVGLFGLVVLGAVFARLDDIASGRNQLGLGSALGVGASKFLTLFGAGIIYGVVVTIGTLLLVVPGIWLSIALAFCFNAIVLDNSPLVESFDVSRKLVAGNWWRVLVILSVAFLILIAIGAGVGMLAGLLLPIGRIVETGGGLSGPSSLAFLFLQIVNGLVNAAIAPLIYAMSYAAYRDLQLRKGGGDLAERIAATA